MEVEPPEPRGKNVKGAQPDPPTEGTGNQREPGDWREPGDQRSLEARGNIALQIKDAWRHWENCCRKLILSHLL